MEQRSELEALMRGGVIRRSRDLVRVGVTTVTIQRELAAGRLEKMSRGTYRWKGTPQEEGQDLALVAVKAPTSLICLHSAAALHGLADASPQHLWVALANDLKPPVLEWPKVRWVRWRREAAFRVGVTERTVCGVRLRVTSAARTVVDLLDVRGGGDRDTGLAALRHYLTAGGSPADLAAFARSLGSPCSVTQIIDLAAVLAGRA